MNSRFSYIILLLFITVRFYSQDIIVKKDSTKLISKLLEINPQKIKYNRFDNLEGPIYVISKNDVAYIIYSNGIKESFHTKPVLANNNKYLSKKDSIIKTLRVKDYIKFNVQIGAAVYSSYCNIRRHASNNWVNGVDEYSPKNSKKYLASPIIGIDSLFGKSPYVKAYLGLNYLRSTGQFNYQSGHGGYESVFRDFNYESKLDYLNFTTGIRFSIANRIHIEPLIAFNLVIHSDIRAIGYTSVTSYPDPTITTYENKKLSKEESDLPHTISLCPKISYSIFKKNTLEVFLSYNISYQYRLPWYMAGITYYPFKKLK